MNTVFLNFLSNHWPHSSPVSIFLTESTPLSTDKGQKHSAARIGHCDFHGRSPRAWATVILIYLDNHIFFVISVSWFWTTIKSLNAHIRWQYSSVQFSPARFESGFALGTFIREYFENQVQLLYENSTFTIQFFPKIRMVCSHGGDKADCAHCTQFTGACALKFAWCANFQHFFCRCAEKTSFRFDPAYPRPNSASSAARKFPRGSRKYLFPVQCIQVCTCVRSKTA